MKSKLAKTLPFILIIIVSLVSYFQIQNLSNNRVEDELNEKVIKGKVLKEVKSEITNFDNRDYTYQELQIEITSGSLERRVVNIETTQIPKYNSTKYKAGDRLLIGFLDNGINNESFYILSYDRTVPLVFLFIIFIVVSTLVARKKSIYSLMGMAMSILILTIFILPAIANGANPLLTSILGITCMVPVLYYVSHGVNRKTTAAVIGTALTLVFTAVIAYFFVSIMHLTGLTFTEIETLLYLKDGNFDMQGVLLAGILMGALGVIDDVAITQASIVDELNFTDKNMSRINIFRKAMNVGRDHIGSVINTLILVYVGSSLATLLLFTEFPRPLLVLLNSEVVLIPITVALIGSIGLILAIPITTFIAVVLIQKVKK